MALAEVEAKNLVVDTARFFALLRMTPINIKLVEHFAVSNSFSVGPMLIFIGEPGTLTSSLFSDLYNKKVILHLNRLKQSPIGYRLAKGTFWSFVGTLIVRVLSMLSSIIVARMLGKAGFGQFGIVQVTLGMFGTLAGLGLGLTATKYVSEFRTTNRVKAGRIIALSEMVSLLSGLVMAGVLFAFAPWIAARTLADPHLAGALKLGSVFLLFTTLTTAQDGTLAGFEAFKVIAERNLTAGIITFPLMLFLVHSKGLVGGLWALIIGTVINWILNYHAIHKECAKADIKLQFSNLREEIPILWLFSFPAALSSILMTPLTWAANTTLAKCTNGYAEMGIYNAANQWRAVIMFVPAMIMQASLPILSQCHGRDEREHFAKTTAANQAVMMLIGIPGGCLLMFLSEYIMSLYGHGFSGRSDVLIITLAGVMVSCMGAATGPAIQAKGMMWLGCAINFSYGLVMFLIAYFTVSAMGAEGLAMASTVSYVVITLWAFQVLKNDVPRCVYVRAYTSILLMALLLCGAFITPVGFRPMLAVPACLISYYITRKYLIGKQVYDGTGY